MIGEERDVMKRWKKNSEVIVNSSFYTRGSQLFLWLIVATKLKYVSFGYGWSFLEVKR